MLQTFKNIVINYDDNLDSGIVEKLLAGINDEYGKIIDFFGFECDKLNLNIFAKVDFDAYVATRTRQFGDKDNIPNWLTRFFYF